MNHVSFINLIFGKVRIQTLKCGKKSTVCIYIKSLRNFMSHNSFFYSYLFFIKNIYLFITPHLTDSSLVSRTTAQYSDKGSEMLNLESRRLRKGCFCFSIMPVIFMKFRPATYNEIDIQKDKFYTRRDADKSHLVNRYIVPNNHFSAKP